MKLVVNTEDYLSIMNDDEKEVCHIEYDYDMEQVVKEITELVNHINNQPENNISLGDLTSIIKCNSCGFNQFIYPEQEIVICEHCGNKIDVRVNLNGFVNK